ncbi:Response regulator transcription factor OS=Streptomyces tendae OX=1932 GN=GUR47_27620 PE=4 SV=1 [Streptomyces tendae]
MFRVLVVDDHRIFAESLAAALAAEPDVSVFPRPAAVPPHCAAWSGPPPRGGGSTCCIEDADLGGHVPGARPAVPVRDGNEDGLVEDGISLVAGVRSGQPGVRIVVLAEKDDPRRAALALGAGASGWVAKDCSPCPGCSA